MELRYFRDFGKPLFETVFFGISIGLLIFFGGATETFGIIWPNFSALFGTVSGGDGFGPIGRVVSTKGR
jgi:hypothetical protein